MDWFYSLFIVSYQVVVKYNTPWLSLSNHNLPYVKEEVFNFAIFVIEYLGTFIGTRTLVCLQNHKEVGDELLTFSHEILFV